MKTFIAALVLLVVSTAPVRADFPDLREPATVVFGIVLVVPVVLYALGEFYTATCEAAGFEYAQDSNGDWGCSGIPRRER